MNKILGAIIVALGVAVFVLLPIKITVEKENSFGSVIRGSEYYSTSTFAGAVAREHTIFTGGGAIGSIVFVSSSAAGGFSVYDAGVVSSTPTTTLFVSPASITAGTYTIDRSIINGLRIVVPSGFNGQVITTYRTY